MFSAIVDYVSKEWPHFMLIIFVIYCVSYIIFVIISFYRAYKGNGTFSFWGLKYETDRTLQKLQKQFDDLNKHSNFKTQVIKFINQTIITIHEWSDLEKDKIDKEEFEKDIKLFYDFFLHGISSLLIKDIENSFRVAVLYKEENNLKILHGSGYSPNGVRSLELNLESSKAGYCYKQKEIYINNNLETDTTFKRNPKSSKNFESLLCVPILYNERVLGVLNIDGLLKDSFDKDDIDYITYFCNAFAPLLYQELQIKNILNEEVLI